MPRQNDVRSGQPIEGRMIASVLATRGGQVEEFDRNIASDADLIRLRERLASLRDVADAARAAA